MLSLKWLLILVPASWLFLYAARVPMHRALRNIGQSVGGAFRLAARWCRGAAEEMGKRSQELAIEGGRENTSKKIEREFHRIETSFAKDLADLPKLHRKLDDLTTKIETDFEECGTSPPRPPGWTEATQAIANVPSGNDKMVQKVLQQLHKSAVTSEKKAFEEYREATSKRHKILATMQPQWKELRKTMEDAGKTCARALDATRRVDGFMQTYEQIRKKEHATTRVLAWSAVNSFIISAIVMAVALGGAFINFQLIALPMSELVPAGSRLMGMPVPSIAALVLVLMEIAAGFFVMEMLGITNLFPQLSNLEVSKRRLVLTLALTGLFLLAGIESSLAILREHIVAAESALKHTLSGAEASAPAATSNIPLIGQAILGFILPWILAMVAIPFEMLINTGGSVALLLGSLVLFGVMYVLRALGLAIRHLTTAVRYLYDVYIIVPLQFEKMARRQSMVPSPVAAGSTTVQSGRRDRKNEVSK